MNLVAHLGNCYRETEHFVEEKEQERLSINLFLGAFGLINS